MDALTDWLRAQLDDYYEVAELAHWETCNSLGDLPHPCNCDLPGFVAADVRAKRAILDLHAPYVNRQGDVQCGHCMELCHSRSGLGCDDPDAPYPCETVTLTAQPYAGRDGWRPEWAL